MSSLTARLLGRRYRKGTKAQAALLRVSESLATQYGTPTLGNYEDPVQEIMYIALSARTNATLCMRAHEALFARFADVEGIAAATIAQVRAVISGSGLGNKRAAQIRSIARRLSDDFGKDSSHGLYRMEPLQAFEYLTGLEGIGPKSALCVMMYSLGMDVFPVDVHIRRIVARLGLVVELGHYEAQLRIPTMVPDGLSHQLHVRLLAHGREVCMPRIPRCTRCVLLEWCKQGKSERRVN
jgi:endonuclease III